MTTTTSLPRVPEGLRDLMKVYTKEVLREKPPDLYEFSAKFFNLIVAEKSHQAVRKYEPVQTYETIMKNRIRQQVPLSMVFNIIPETLTDLIKKFIKAVLREKPENIYIFAQEYFQKLSKEKSGRIEYTKYSTYEKSLKDKENVAPVSKVTCECGRVLSAQARDLSSTKTAKSETINDQTTISTSISYVKSVVIIQRHFRRYLKQKKTGREKNKCNSVEYMTAIILIQRQFRRVLAKKRVEKLRSSRPPKLSYVKFNAANYMKAVVVIQRHYRIYLKRKQEREHNRLKTDPVSLATAAIIIQRAFRRMVGVRRARRAASVTADPGEELNDNASETGSYTSVSTALLSTESTELGIASYEERVHQKIIHEDEEVENNNVDASLEKEYFAEPIKGDDESIDPRKSEILSGALIENMVLKTSQEKDKALSKESAELEVSGSDAEKPLEPIIEDKFEAIKATKQTGSTNETTIKTTENSKEVLEENKEFLGSEKEKPLEAEIEDGYAAKKAGSDLDSALETKIKTKQASVDLQQEIEAPLETKKASVDLEVEAKDDIKAINLIQDQEPEIKDRVEPDDNIKGSAKPAVEVVLGNAFPNKIESIESDVIKEFVSKEIEETPKNPEEENNIGKDDAVLSEETIPLAKVKRSESQEMPEKPIETKIIPAVSIEIDLVDDDTSEQSILILPDADAIDNEAKGDTSLTEPSPSDDKTKDILDDDIPEQPISIPPDADAVNSGKDLSDGDSLENQPDSSLPTVEIDSLKTVLANHNRQVREQEMSPDEDTEKPGEAPTEIPTQDDAISAASSSTNKQENEVSIINRQKRSLDESENSVTCPQPQSMDIQLSINESEKAISAMTAEKGSIEDPETQSNLESQDPVNKVERVASPLTRGKRSIEDTEIGSPKSSLHAQESIVTDDADSSITKINQDEINQDVDQQSAELEATLEMDDKYKEEVMPKQDVAPKEDLTGLVDAETGEITVHKPLEEITEPLKQEISNDQAPQTDLIEDFKEKEDQKNEMEVDAIEPIVPDRTSSVETSNFLTGTEKEGEIIHHLEEAVGLLMDPKIEKNTDTSPEEPKNSIKKVPDDLSDASYESKSLEEHRKLSHQETMPIGSDLSQVEDLSPSSIGKEGNSIEDKNKESSNSMPDSDTDEITLDGKIITKESATISASSVLGEDITTSMQPEVESLHQEVSVDSTSNENTINAPEHNVETGTPDEEGEVIYPSRKTTADKAQQSTEANVEGSVSAVKEISSEGSVILQAGEEPEETVSLEPETFSVEDSNLKEKSEGLGKGSSMTEDPGSSIALDSIDSKKISIDQSPESNDNISRDLKGRISPTSLKISPSLESFQNNEKRAEESTVAEAALAMVAESEASKTKSLNETDQEHIPAESVNTATSVETTNIADNPEIEGIDTGTKDDKSLTEPSLIGDILASQEDTKPESDLVEGSIASHPEDTISKTETKAKDNDGIEIIKSSSLEDTVPTSKEKALRRVPSHPERNSSLLVTNQLIGTQNLTTNHIEIEKNTKKLSSASVKDKDKGKDIGTLTSGRLVPTPIAELQLKSFKAPNDDGAWYDIYVEPQPPSGKDLDSPPAAAPVTANQTDKDQEVTPEVEPIVVAERVPSYYTPKEIAEPTVPKAKNSISFFVSFDSDDGKPKYKIPKRFRDQSKGDTSLDKKSDPEPENNEEDIEVIEVSEGDPEYQQLGGSKLQTIMELNENEHPEVSELSKDITGNDKVDLESGIIPESLSEDYTENHLVDSAKSNTENFESIYKTDILNIIRSVQIIERAYRRFKNRRLLDRQESDNYKKQNNAAKIIQKWVRNIIRNKIQKVPYDISLESKKSQAARKIQRAYRRYMKKPKETNLEKDLISEHSDPVLEEPIKVYKSTEVNASPSSIIKEEDKPQELKSRPRSNPAKEFSGLTELQHHQAAEKIQRAYKRYLNRASKPVILNLELEEPIKVYKSTKVSASSSSKITEEDKSQELRSRPSSNPANDYSDLTELKHHQAAEKIQRAYKMYLNRVSKPVLLDSELEEPIKVYKSTEVNASFKITEEDKPQEFKSKSSSNPSKDFSDLTELKHHQAAEKIQKAYKRYLNRVSKPVILDLELEEPIKVYKSTEVNASSKIKKEDKHQESINQELKSRPSSSQENYFSDLTELKHHQAAEKIQRAYKMYLNRVSKPVILDSELEEPIKVYKSTEVNASPSSQVKEEDKSQELRSRPSSNPANDFSDLTELKHHQAAEKIQRAYKRYLNRDSKPVNLDSELEEPVKAYKSTEVNSSPKSKPSTVLSSDKLKEADKIQEDNSRPSSSPVEDLSGLNESQQHQAAGKIQRAFRRYLKQSKGTEIGALDSKESRRVEKPVEVIPSEGMTSAALIIQRAFRQYMERRKLEHFDEISLDSITSSRITAIENSMFPTEGTPSDSLTQEEIAGEDATKVSPKSEWFVGSTRIVPSQEVVEEPLELETEPDPAEITRNTELDTSTQVESVDTVDRSHGSLESKLTPGISSSKIDENQGNTSKQDNAVSSGLAGLTEAEAPEATTGSAEDRVLSSQSDLGGIFQTLDIASTQELVNDFLQNEILFSSAQGPFLNGNQLQEVIEEPCIKRSASLVSLSEGDTGNDSSKSEATGLDTLSADTIDKATVKLSKPEEVIEKMSQLRDSKSSERILSAEPSFDEPIVRPMSSLQEQASLDIEDGDIIVYNRLQRDETRESSAQSDSVVFGDAESEKILEREMATEEESGRVHLMRHYTIAGDDPRGLFRSVTIDDALSYGEMGEKDLDASLGINSTNSFYLDDETSENIRKKMMAYSLSETDSDYFDPKKISKEDFDIDTAMADAMGTSTETESTIVSAATKIQAGARGFLTRRRLRRASAGTKSSTMDTKASFGNDAISESLERFIEEEAAKKIQAAYRIHTRKRKGKTRRMEGISLESNLAARRQKLQRGDALRNDSTPDDENSSSTNGGQKEQKHSRSQRTKAGGDTKSRAAMELKWLSMRQNSMPVQIDCEVFRVIPKHMRKRIKSAESSKRK